MKRPVSRELELLLQCARPTLEAAHSARINALANEGLDWDDLAKRAAWHRMLPLLRWHLDATCPSAVPEEVQHALASHFILNAHRMLRTSAELAGILSALREAGIPALPYKGPVLAARLYNNLALRASGDLDIVVRRADVLRARERLIELNYRPRYPISQDQLPFMLASRYSETLVREDFAHVEVHWAFTNRDIAFALDCETLLARAATSKLGNIDIPVLANDDLALVLCVHGAKHRWNRLEWIAGLATLVRAVPDLDYDALLTHALALRSNRRVLLGLLVARDVCDAPCPNEIIRSARANRAVMELSAEVCQSLDVVHAQSAHRERSASLPFDWFHLRLADSLRDKRRLVAYRLTTPSQPKLWNTVRWGKRSLPLHAITRPLRVALRIGPAAWAFIRERNGRHDLDNSNALGTSDAAHMLRSRTRGQPSERVSCLRILQLVQKPQRRGAEIFAHAFDQWVRRQGHYGRMVYLYPHAGATTLPLSLGDAVLGEDEQHWCERVPGVQPAVMNRLRDIVADFAPDIVVLNGSRTVKYGAVLRMLERSSKWKLVYRNIDSPKFWLRGTFRTALYSRVVMPRVDAVIGISRRTLSEVESVYKLGVPHIFVPNAVDFEHLLSGVDGRDVRAATNTPPNAIVALFIGHLSRQKRPDRFLRVIQRAVREMPSTYGWLLGDGPDRAALEAQARELGIESHVRFLGYQDKVAPYIAAADMYVSTSDTEGLPTVVIEAGYLGKPTVAMRVGGMDECVLDGETGLLAARGDEQTVVDHLVHLARDPGERTRMGEKARAWMSNEFGMARVGEEYLAFFRSLRGGMTISGDAAVAGQEPAISPNETWHVRHHTSRKTASPPSRG